MGTFTWTGNTHDGDWSDAGNWTPGSGPPGSSDTAKITISSDVFVESVVTVGELLNSTGDIEPAEGKRTRRHRAAPTGNGRTHGAHRLSGPGGVNVRRRYGAFSGIG